MSALVVDTSAAVAILTGEAGGEDLIEELAQVDERLMAAPTLVELGIVMEARLGPAGQGVVERFVREADIQVVPFDRAQVDRALEGWRRFGKGRHRAALNLGDCFTYGLALEAGQPVLCLGEDFALTDVTTVGPVQPPA